MMFLGSLIEGVNIMLLGGFFAARGYFSFPIVWIMMFLGDVLGDILWYFTGYFGGNKLINRLRRFSGLQKQFAKVKFFLEKKGGRVIMFIKFTAGLCLAMLITAGTVKMNFKKFIKYDIIGSIGWTTLMCSLGYFFGESYELLSQHVERISFLITGIAIAALLAVKIAQKAVIKARGLE